MAQNPIPPSREPNTIEAVLAYSKRFLLYGFAISIVLHLVFGPFVRWQRTPEQGERIEKVSVSKKIKVVTPRPTPTPPPSPTPTPVTHTPPPQTPPPKQLKLLVHPPKQSSESKGGPSENAYTNTKGSESGVPQGTLNTGPPATAAPPPAAPSPSPSPTKPACANPKADATATQKVTPDMPEVARQMGATGTAQIKVTLDAKGNVTATSIYKSTGNRALDQAALQAAQQSKYSPDIRDCVGVAGSYLYVVTFESQ